MAITRWEPFRELVSLRQAMDRLFEDSFVRPSRLWTGVEAGGITIDAYQTTDDVVIKANLPDIKPEEVDVSITDDAVTIKGETKAEEEIKREDYLYQERRYGAFSRTVRLPGSLQTDKAEAVFENGVLTLTIPKAAEAKPKTVKVKVGGKKT